VTRDEAEKESDLWGVNDETESMSAETPDEAIGEYLENLAADLEPEAMPAEITLRGFKRMQPTSSSCGTVLDNVLEHLDEEHGNPNSYGFTQPTPAMLEAEKVFKAAVLAEYKAWACEEIYSEEIDVREWCERTGSLDLIEKSTDGTP